MANSPTETPQDDITSLTSLSSKLDLLGSTANTNVPSSLPYQGKTPQPVLADDDESSLSLLSSPTQPEGKSLNEALPESSELDQVNNDAEENVGNVGMDLDVSGTGPGGIAEECVNTELVSGNYWYKDDLRLKLPLSNP